MLFGLVVLIAPGAGALGMIWAIAAYSIVFGILFIGLAFRVPHDLREEAASYLRGRELVTSVYLERMLPIRLASCEHVEAVTYVVDRSHGQYAGRLDEPTAARIVSGAIGQAGPNEEYVLNTIAHLKALGIRDHWLEEVGRLVS